MDQKLKGSWLIHHTNKLQAVTNQLGFEKTYVSGKCGILLSAISSNSQVILKKDKLETLARASNINTITELPIIIEVLKKRELIDVTGNGIAVLGVTTSSTLQHTSDIFDFLEPTPQENAAIDIAERASLRPIKANEIQQEIADIYRIDRATTEQLIYDSEQIGFVDVENMSGDERILFNGNLFRRETARKTKLILDSLSSQEQSKLSDVNEILRNSACAPVEKIKTILGNQLFDKISAIGLYDITEMLNTDTKLYIVSYTGSQKLKLVSKTSSPQTNEHN